MFPELRNIIKTTWGIKKKKSESSQKHLRNGSSQLQASLVLAGTLGSQQLQPAKINTATRLFPMLLPREGPAPLLSPAMIMTRLLGFNWGSDPCPPLKQLLFC